MNGARVFDRVHGEVILPPLCAAVAATVEFQRLDGVRQLGGTSFVYPSATHTRREHSLGVCHLAGLLGAELRKQRPDLVDDDDVLCLQLAGLVHDLGHGPFSHLFETYMHRHDPNWSHEEMGLHVLDRLLSTNVIFLPDHFRGDALAQRRFVGLLVCGLDASEPWPGDLVGRPEAKRFLVDVVHSRATGLDVDKLDYLVRDALAVFGATNAMSIGRLIAAARIVDAGGGRGPVLAFDESVAYDVREVFALRARMHRKVYQHRAVAVAEGILVDLLEAVDQCLPEERRFRNAAACPERFARLCDASLLGLPFHSDPILAPALDVWELLHRRPWYRRVPVTVSLRTKPRCTACGAATEVADAFCTACGAATVGRDHVVLPCGLRAAPEAVLTEREAAEAVAARLSVGTQVGVRISDVVHGAPHPERDPHGDDWIRYDALRTVRFAAHDGRAFRISARAHGVSFAGHTRVAHCYVPVASNDAQVADATRALQEWGATVGTLHEVWEEEEEE